jgi:exopolysaccharide biosynthesis polyprenyl glycosylphosphotransferase
MTEPDYFRRQQRAAGNVTAPAAPAGPRGRPAALRMPASRQASGLRRRRWPFSGRRDGWLASIAGLPLVDVLALAAAAGASGRISLPTLAYGGAVFIVLALGGHQRLRICLRVSDQAGRIAAAAAVPSALLLPWLPVGLAWRLALFSAISVIAARGIAGRALRAAHRRGLLTEPALVVGAGEMGVLIADLLHQHPELGLRPLGFLDSCPPPNELPLPVLGTAADLPAMICRFRVRRVIVCFPVDTDPELVPVLRACQPLRVDVCLVPRLPELGAAVPRACLDEVWGVPLIPLRSCARAPAERIAKRVFDVLAAGSLLCALSPVLLVLAAIIRLRSGRPALFRQVRVTGDERIAPIIKLRTLDEHGDSDTRWSVPARQCGQLSHWLRATHLDELPQLMNVLRGEMSLVGPRPERPYFAERFGREIPGYRDRTRMLAGITGWAQVHGLHGDTSIGERARFDNQYIEYWSPWLDMVILARTLAAAVSCVPGGRP